MKSRHTERAQLPRLGVALVLYSLLQPPAAGATSLQIVASGFPDRNGVLQLKAALQILGYKVHSLGDINSHPTTRLEQYAMWSSEFRLGKAACATNSSFVQFVFSDEGFTAAVGFLAVLCWEGLAKTNPHAKIIHTEMKSTSAWWHDAHSTFLTAFCWPSFHPWDWHAWPTALFLTFPRRDPLLDFFESMMEHTLGVEGGKIKVPEDSEFPLGHKDLFTARYDQNNAKARAVSSTRLIVHDQTNGWPKLCAFLGKPIPKTAYPTRLTVFDWRVHKTFFVLKVLGSGMLLGGCLWSLFLAFVAWAAFREVRYLHSVLAATETATSEETWPVSKTRPLQAEVGGGESRLNERFGCLRECVSV